VPDLVAVIIMGQLWCWPWNQLAWGRGGRRITRQDVPAAGERIDIIVPNRPSRPPRQPLNWTVDRLRQSLKATW